MKPRIWISALLMLSIATGMVMIGCGDDTTELDTVYNRILLHPTQLPTLKSGLIYEGWVVKIDEDTNWIDQVSFGKFFWDEFNFFFLSPSDTTLRIDSVFQINGNAYDYDMIALTLESHPNDASAEPSPTVVAASMIDPNRVTEMRFPINMDAAKGKYLIATFSDGRYTRMGQGIENETSGLWFLDLESFSADSFETYADSLKLPELPPGGYLYEGWVSLDNGYVLSTGKFGFPGARDFDNSHCANGAIPNFPGEDFLVNAPTGLAFPVDLTGGGETFITIEPEPDNDVSTPSNFIVLQRTLTEISGNVRRISISMTNKAATSFPKVSVQFQQ